MTLRVGERREGGGRRGSSTHPAQLSLLWTQAADWLTGAVTLTLRGFFESFKSKLLFTRPTPQLLGCGQIRTRAYPSRCLSSGGWSGATSDLPSFGHFLCVSSHRDLGSIWWALLGRVSKEAVISGHNLSRFSSSDFSDLD